jgi:hypothetical protein
LICAIGGAPNGCCTGRGFEKGESTGKSALPAQLGVRVDVGDNYVCTRGEGTKYVRHPIVGLILREYHAVCFRSFN